MGHIMKTITLLFILLLYPLKMPQGQDMKQEVIRLDFTEGIICYETKYGKYDSLVSMDENWIISGYSYFHIDSTDTICIRRPDAVIYDHRDSAADTTFFDIPDCSQVFRIVRVAHLDSVYVQKYPYSHNLTRIQFLCDTMPEYHWEHVVRYSYDSVLVRDTTVYLGE